MQVAHARLKMSCIHLALLHLQLQGKMWAYDIMQTLSGVWVSIVAILVTIRL